MDGAKVSPVCRVASVKSVLEPVNNPNAKPPLPITIGIAPPQLSLGGTAAYNGVVANINNVTTANKTLVLARGSSRFSIKINYD